MKKTKKHNLSKQIICIIIFLMLCNFIVPNYVYAVDEGDGGDLFVDIAQLFCFVPDIIIETLQKAFVADIGIQGINGEYKIMYSAGAIFAGQIPMFDIDFINPENANIATYDDYVREVLKNNYENAKGNDKSENYIKAQAKANCSYIEENIQLSDSISSKMYAYYWVDEENRSLNIECKYPILTGGSNYLGGATGASVYYSTSVSLDDEEVKAAYEISKNNKSTAVVLQPIIATWYNALRKIALVGLLSVLVYIGIRIVLTSTSASDKAKYKKMLKDWLVAFCILFTLHYIMSITTTVVNNLAEIIKPSVVGVNGEDILMSAIRNKIAEKTWGDAIVRVFMYCVLAVYTIIFTVQYLRRAVYIAFLTVIAPLITLTYPLDKIKDSKSQAFDMWIKDYIFFALLQVIHLLIYYILVGSSINLLQEGNWLYAIVAIGFLTKAEKIVKKMFGFEKSNSMGALAAGATGALVMNIMKQAPNKENKKSKGEKNNNNVRTATEDPIAKLKAKGARINTGLAGSNPLPAKVPPTVSQRVIQGAKTLHGEYTAKLAKGTLEAISSISFGAMGAAAGFIDGDFSDAITGAMLGAKTGKNLARGAINSASNVKKSGNEIRDTFNQGAFGKDAAQNMKFDREFKRSEEYKEFRKKYKGSVSDDQVQDMLNAGITDVKAMEKIIDNVAVGNVDNIEDAMGFYALSQLCGDDVFYNDRKLRRWLDDKGFAHADLGMMRTRMTNFRG